MGWLFMFEMATRKAMIADRIAPQEWVNPDGTKCSQTTLAHTFKGSPFAGVLYYVRETRIGEKTDRFIQIDLLRYSKTDGPGCWGYKDMTEECGPNHVSCPRSYLGMVPCPDNQIARAWRGRVLAWHDERYKIT
jgi:hypothetical protein